MSLVGVEVFSQYEGILLNGTKVLAAFKDVTEFINSNKFKEMQAINQEAMKALANRRSEWFIRDNETYSANLENLVKYSKFSSNMLDELRKKILMYSKKIKLNLIQTLLPAIQVNLKNLFKQ